MTAIPSRHRRLGRIYLDRREAWRKALDGFAMGRTSYGEMRSAEASATLAGKLLDWAWISHRIATKANP